MDDFRRAAACRCAPARRQAPALQSNLDSLSASHPRLQRRAQFFLRAIDAGFDGLGRGAHDPGNFGLREILVFEEDDGLAQIAQRVGYESEVTFSKAFRTWAGEPPGRYRRRMRGAAR